MEQGASEPPLLTEEGRSTSVSRFTDPCFLSGDFSLLHPAIPLPC